MRENMSKSMSSQKSLTEPEWRRRKMQLKISEEQGRLKKKDEVEAKEMWKRKQDHEAEWEGTRAKRVSSWRDFMKGGKKAKKGELRPPKLKTEDPNKSYVQRPVNAADWPGFCLAGEGAPPPQRAPAAFPITFPPRQVRRIPVFRRDHPKLQIKSISSETGIRWPRWGSPGRESDRGRCWSLLGWRRAVVCARGW
ncbi:hypothetical protein ACLB2K_047383 [Fragaria x ananassa]